MTERARNVHVSAIPSNTTVDDLKAAFAGCGTVVSAKLITPKPGTTRTYGFIGFAEEISVLKAVHTGVFVGTRRLRVQRVREPVRETAPRALAAPPALTDSPPRLRQNNLYVSGIPPDMSKESLAGYFERVGPVNSVKILETKSVDGSRAAMVRMQQPRDADRAISLLSGKPIEMEPYGRQGFCLAVSFAFDNSRNFSRIKARTRHRRHVDVSKPETSQWLARPKPLLPQPLFRPLIQALSQSPSSASSPPSTSSSARCDERQSISPQDQLIASKGQTARYHAPLQRQAVMVDNRVPLSSAHNGSLLYAHRSGQWVAKPHAPTQIAVPLPMTPQMPMPMPMPMPLPVPIQMMIHPAHDMHSVQPVPTQFQQPSHHRSAQQAQQAQHAHQSQPQLVQLVQVSQAELLQWQAWMQHQAWCAKQQQQQHQQQPQQQSPRQCVQRQGHQQQQQQQQHQAIHGDPKAVNMSTAKPKPTTQKEHQGMATVRVA